MHPNFDFRHVVVFAVFEVFVEVLAVDDSGQGMLLGLLGEVFKLRFVRLDISLDFADVVLGIVLFEDWSAESTDVFEFDSQLLVLCFEVFELLLRVLDDLDCGRVLLLELVQVFVAVFDLLVERLVLDFKLLEVYEVQAFSQLVLVFHFLL